jgi:hypothetical protein
MLKMGTRRNEIFIPHPSSFILAEKSEKIMIKETSPSPVRPGKISALWLGIVALLTLCVVPSRADVFNYAAARRQIRACVLTMNTALGAGGLPQNAAPHLFYVLDRRTDVKPGGWDFTNPLSPTVVNGTVRTRWAARGADATVNSPLFRLNAPVTKNLGAYWEVNLDDVSSEDLQQFDIVYMGFRGNVNFTAEQREKLRRYADAGGTIWLEDLGGMNIGTPFVIPVGFSGSAISGGIGLITNRNHPIVSFPYSLTTAEGFAIGLGGANNRRLHAPIFNNASSGMSLVPIVGTFNNFALSATEFGAGHIIVSSAGIATSVAGYAGGTNVEGGNTGAVSGENVIAAQPQSLKVAYNIVAYASSVPSGAVNARRTGSVGEQIGSGLGRAWATVPFPATNTGSGVVVHKGVAFYINGNNILQAFDVNPATDLDGNRIGDDGAPDNGAPYDLIWQANLGIGRFGTPTIASVMASNGALVELVVVTSTTGSTAAFPAFPRNGNGTLAATNVRAWLQTAGVSPGGNLPPNAPAFSPAFSEGILFVPMFNVGSDANNPWHIAAIDPVNNGLSVFGGPPAASLAPTINIPGVSGLGDITGSPTVGYVRDLATGAIDKMIYVPARPAGAQQGSGSIQGVWFQTKNEPLVQVGSTNAYAATGDRGKVPWYVPTAAGNPDLVPQIHILTRNPATGQIIGVVTHRFPSPAFTLLYSGTAPDRTMQVILTSPLLPNQTVTADYTLNWPAAPMPVIGAGGALPTAAEMARFSTQRRYGLYSPDPNNVPAFATGSPAMSGQDALIYNATIGTAEDRTYALREQINAGLQATGRRSPREMMWMFSPNGPGQFSLPNAQTVQFPARLINGDTFANWLPAAGGTTGHFISGFRAIGSPAVSGNVAYVIGTAALVQGSTGSGIPVTVIMALNANPSNTFNIGQPIPNDGTAVILRQVDALRSTTTNTQFVRLVENDNFILDRASGTVTIINYRSSQDGETFNAALPFYVSVGNTQNFTPIVDGRTGRSPLDNLLWYMVIPQGAAPGMSAPLLSLLRGNLPGAGTASLRPSSGLSVVGNVLHFGTAEGRVASVDTNGVGNGAQASLFTRNSDGTFTPRVQLQDVLQFSNGANAGATYNVNNAVIYPPVGTTNTVFAGSPGGIAALDNRLTLIADNNRLLQVDWSGNAVWSSSVSRTLNIAGGDIFSGGQIAATSVPLSRPSVARHYTLSSFLVADTGNNRVVMLDKGGTTVLELRQVLNDLQFLRPNDPLTLSQPTDVQIISESGTGISFTNRTTGVVYTFNGAYTASHFFIADSGNNRLLEVIYAYDASGAPVVATPSNNQYPPVTLAGQVIFASRSLAEQNANYRYRTVQQFAVPQGNNPPQIYIAAAVDNQRVLSTDPATQIIGSQNTAGGTGGSLVILKRDYNPNPALNKDGDTVQTITSIGIDTDNDGMANQRLAIKNPTWFKQFDVLFNNAVVTRYMLCDDNGCYVLSPVGNDLLVEWVLTADQYYAMTGRRLKAVSMQKLTISDYDAGTNRFYPRYLITNAYAGQDNIPEVFGVPQVMRGSTRGEVFEIRSKDFYANGYSTLNGLYSRVGNSLTNNTASAIVWMFPVERFPATDAGGNPLGPIIRAVGSQSNATSTFLLEQPSFAERPN